MKLDVHLCRMVETVWRSFDGQPQLLLNGLLRFAFSQESASELVHHARWLVRPQRQIRLDAQSTIRKWSDCDS